MSKNPITDAHVGARGPAWDHDGFAEVRHKLGFNDDTHLPHRSARKKPKDEPPSWRDYPLGSRIVAVTKGRTGFVSHFLCRVIDAYEFAQTRWKRRYVECRVYVVIEATTAEHEDQRVGHIDTLYYGEEWPRYSWGDDRLRPTTKSVADFRAMPREMVKKEPK